MRRGHNNEAERIHGLALAVLGFVACALASSAALAQVQSPYTLLHNFDCTKNAQGQVAADGCTPGGPGFLAQGRDGNLYGTVPTGGALPTGKFPGGTIFSIAPNLTAMNPFAVLYTLGFNSTDGFESKSGLTLGTDGIFYGTAVHGGASSNPKGSVFSFGGNGFSTLYPFTNGMDGAYPYAPPIQAPDGNLYGVTYNGSTRGTIYRVTPTTGFSIIATLNVDTTAALVPAFDGNLYGTTQAGSVNAQGVFSPIGGGTIFRIPMSAAGAVPITFLHSFDSTKTVLTGNGQQVLDGGSPKGPVMFGHDGNLYGTTSAGGSAGYGVIYQLNPNTGAYKILHSFPLVKINNMLTAPDGSGSESGLVQGSDGFLYGVAPAGGANGAGTLFKVNTTGTSFQVLWPFGNSLQCGSTSSNDGSNPVSTPMLHTNGKIYGMTPTGGCRKAYGTIYSFGAGLKPFASIVGGSRVVKVGDKVGVIGQGFNSATGVLLGSLPLGKLAAQILSDTYLVVTVPSTQLPLGPVSITVLMPSGNLTTPQVVSTTPSQCGTATLCRQLPPVRFGP